MESDGWCLLRVFLSLCSLSGVPLLTQGAAVCCTRLVLPHGAHGSQDGPVQVLCVVLQLLRLFGNQSQRVSQSWKAKTAEWR